MVAGSANASLTFETPSGSTTSGGGVDATATFTMSDGKVVVTLQNLFENPTAISQLISGISFDISGAHGGGSLITMNSGYTSSIASGGSYTPGTLDSLNRWTASESGTTITEWALSGGTPSRLIIGPDDAGGFTGTGRYSDANPSITGNHNPSVLGSSTFTITIPGVTASSTLQNVYMQFGTTASANCVQLVPVPEPTTLIAGALLLLPFGLQGFRHSRNRIS